MQSFNFPLKKWHFKKKTMKNGIFFGKKHKNGIFVNCAQTRRHNPNPSVPTRPKPDHPKPETRGTRNASGGFGMNFLNSKPDAPEPEKSDPCAPLVWVGI